MAPESALPTKIGDLSIYAKAGEIRNSRGMSVRLGPVNMRILNLLVSRAGRVVLRSEIFEEIWKNQVVSDDALTRCISDIRAALGELSENSKYIETIPKRGYRWNTDTGETALAGSPNSKAVIWFGRGILYMAALVVIASSSAWLMDKLAQPGPLIVVVLPTQSNPTQHDFALRTEQQISEYLVSVDRVGLLSRTAMQSRPINPFPYFFHEFGARWLIESELRAFSEHTILTIVVVDARAGIELFRITDKFPNDEYPATLDTERILGPLEGFIDSQLGL